MAPVLQLCRSLATRPESLSISGVAVRTFETDGDIDKFLDLRHSLLPGSELAYGSGRLRRFFAGVHQPLVVAANPNVVCGQESEIATGGPNKSSASPRLPTAANRILRGWWCVLVVLPTARRRGIGRLLMAHVETRGLGRRPSRGLFGNPCPVASGGAVLRVARVHGPLALGR